MTAAVSIKQELLDDLSERPLGSAPGESNLQTPYNASPGLVLVSIKNHSATAVRRVIDKAVSERRGGGVRALDSDMKSAGYSVETIQREAAMRDMSSYKDVVRPQVATIRFDGKLWYIPPAKHKDEDPEPVPVPEGVWDLYMGNYERMHSPDASVRLLETRYLNERWTGAHSAVMVFDADGNHDFEANPFGFLEFIREDRSFDRHAFDTQSLPASAIVEV